MDSKKTVMCYARMPTVAPQSSRNDVDTNPNETRFDGKPCLTVQTGIPDVSYCIVSIAVQEPRSARLTKHTKIELGHRWKRL